MAKGKLITFEGAEGSGKTTQCRLVYDYLRRHHRPVFLVREPGGVKISEAVREILLDVRNVRMSDECEVLLYMAARAQLVSEVIAPALKKGKIVLCDRFLDSTLAYQGYGNGVAISKIKEIGRFATLGIAPDLTLVFDIDARTGLMRRGKNRDRIERRAVAYHERVRRGYLTLARQEPKRIKVVRVGTRSPEEISGEVQGHFRKILGILR